MSILNKLNELSIECVTQIVGFYDNFKIPFYVRRIYAEQIEKAVCGPYLNSASDNAIWMDFDVDLTQRTTLRDKDIHTFVTELVQDLETRMNGQGATPIPLEIRPQVTKHFPELKTSDPSRIFSKLRQCIQLELDMIRTQKPLMNPCDPTGQTLNSMQLKIAKNQSLLLQLEAEGNQLACTLGNQRAFNQQEITSRTADEILWNQQNEQLIEAKIAAIQLLQLQITEICAFNVNEAASLQRTLYYDYIVVWKTQQQKVLNGSPLENPVSLDTLQVWFEELATQVLTILQQIRQFNNTNQRHGSLDPSLLPVNLSDFEGKIKEVLRLLANNCFLVNNQPPQVMKKATKFPKPVSACLTLGNKFKVGFKDSTVYVTLINERQAKLFVNSTDSSDSWELSSDGRSGELKSEKKAFVFDEKLTRYVADFKYDLQLNAITRADRRNSVKEIVTEEKFCLCFRSTVQIEDVEIRLHTLSLPVVVTSHGSQEAQAIATIMWDNGFGGIDRTPFDVPNSISWNQLASAISNRFLLVAGLGLNDKHIKFLKNKAFRGRECADSELLSWQDFCKEPLPDRNFSFWEWVYGVLRLLEKKETNMKDMWAKNLIEGFIEKVEAEQTISQFHTGYFLLRFSESIVGAILIVWKGLNGSYSVKPFELQQLTEERRKLADRLRRFRQLAFLYPSMEPKDAVLKCFYSPERTSTSGYTIVEENLPDPPPNPSTNACQRSPLSVSASDANLSPPSGQSESIASTTFNWTDVNLTFNDIQDAMSNE